MAQNELLIPLLPPPPLGDDDDDDDDDEPDPEYAATTSTAAASSRAAARKQRGKKIRRIKRRASAVSAAEAGAMTKMMTVSNATDDDNDDIAAETTTEDADDDGESDSDESETTEYSEEKANIEKEVPREKMTPGQMAKAAAVALLTTGGVASYLVALVTSIAISSVAATAAVGVAGGVCLLTVPLVWWSEWRLAHMPTLRKRVYDLINSANRFKVEVELLRQEEEDLKEEVDSLEVDYVRLEKLVKEQNAGSVEEFVSLVHDNQVVLRQMKDYLRQVILQDVVKIALRSDVDRDNRLNMKEAKILETRLALSAGVYNIVFDAEKFRRAVGPNPTLFRVMAIVKRLLPDESGRGRRGSLYDSIVSDSDSETTAEEMGKEDIEEDVYDMFYVPVENELKIGDVDSIRLSNEHLSMTGEPPLLMSISTSRIASGDMQRLMSLSSSSIGF